MSLFHDYPISPGMDAEAATTRARALRLLGRALVLAVAVLVGFLAAVILDTWP